MMMMTTTTTPTTQSCNVYESALYRLLWVRRFNWKLFLWQRIVFAFPASSASRILGTSAAATAAAAVAVVLYMSHGVLCRVSYIQWRSEEGLTKLRPRMQVIRLGSSTQTT